MGARSGLTGFLTNWLLYGHLAVDLFIVLSGFCLMMPAAQSGSLRGGSLSFYWRRCRRILPPLWAALALFTLHGFAVQFHQEHRVELPSLPLLLANVLLLQDVLQQYNRIDGVAWSVAVEWKIYFLFPLLIWVWQRRGISALLATGALLAAAASALLYFAAPHLNMALACPWYVFLFALGAFGAALVFSPSQRTLPPLWPFASAALALLALLLMRYPITSRGSVELFDPHFLLIDPVAGVAATLLLMMTLRSQSGRRSFALTVLSWQPLVFAGSFAYSIYLVHILFKNVAFTLADHAASYFGSGIAETVAATVIGLPLVLGGSYLFHLAFERPFMSRPGTKVKTDTQAEAMAIASPAP